MPRTRSIVTAAGSAAVLAALAATGPADAGAPTPTHKTLARHLLSPLSLAVDGSDVYVTQNFGGILSKLRPDKAPKTLYHSTTNEVGGVSARGGTIVFTETASDDQGPTDSWLKMLRPSGKAKTIAHIRAYENKHNPDGMTEYGVRGIPDDCAAQWPTADLGPAVYTGALDSHPYATFQTKKRIYVADAGMNAVLAVSSSGHIRTVAVMPPTAVPITQALADGAGVPDCAVGLTYYGESVPTDVVRGGVHDKLYVTLEGGGLGEQMPLGRVLRLEPDSGRVRLIAGHLFAPTGLAVTPGGTIYVAQLFGNKITKIRYGSYRRTFVNVPLPGAVEFSGGKVYATTRVLPPEKGAPDGRVVSYRP